ncbi:MAG: hypothetical protein CMJ18_00955 [Phycisphaeraceae bacterium]|nr:hypothetical protein [Phycisphaeraceae bacterium]
MRDLSAIVVTLGDDPRVHQCLEALAAAWPSAHLQLVLVENGAQGPAPPLPIEPAVRLRRAANPGFAQAVNEGLAVSTGDLILTLNPDARVEADAVATAVRTLDGESGAGAVAFRLVRPGATLLDSAGIRLGLIRRARDRGMGQPASGQFLERADVDAACMACALFDPAALHDARDGAGEILDSRYFAYKEDVDLGWRLRRAGYRIVYEPAAVAEHQRGWREGERKAIPRRLRVLSLRNRWFTILKNESPLSLFLRMALYVPTECGLLAWLAITEPGVLRAYPRILAGFWETMRRRKLRADLG